MTSAPIFPEMRGSSAPISTADTHHSVNIGQHAAAHYSALPNILPHSSLHHEAWPCGTTVAAPIALQPSAHVTQHQLGQAVPGTSGSTIPPSKGFSCPLLSCGRLFKRLEQLKRHVRTHTQERPYECTRCAKRFSRSDNLTQHIKTHEKADRGERLKTEASESTEDDIAILLEAEVDAMAARETKGYHVSAPPEQSYALSFGQSQPVSSGHFSPSRVSMLSPSFSGAEDHPSHVMPNSQSGRSPLVRPDWTPMSNPAIFGALSENPLFSKRHRSMTPNLPPSGRTNITESHTAFQASNTYLGASRYHPYAP
ncbi:uncharacterized protein I206_101550 [Kwoniella pini CBS 10737]|uniref:C2H2-type domain-containing protein n=1 Tax=Kwoniella pini CBS 10737 TaxID=1296096 RepID=A0A1B9HWB9_9TREE|nr:uncharacterized protein I206_06478 [Kwoniella pini CBS 10737]OCF47575.1 hypothetical protein I206_06478 [Kwoniella pini CBS 10737]